eukprot:TRINITY_DN19507_c0_g1_i2.p1 TRINITY_DN19507_c0_g1~~TRINITY_DN19507_c0_g1_i2.p1  ORF type:complete len:146 (-),score=26.18 TRINITY_DN19507_c0_g1_i2:368-805(-)
MPLSARTLVSNMAPRITARPGAFSSPASRLVSTQAAAAAPIATKATSLPVQVYGFNEEGKFALLTEEDAWNAMATGMPSQKAAESDGPTEWPPIPEHAASLSMDNGAASSEVDAARAWIQAWRDKQVSGKEAAQRWIAAWRSKQG